MWQRPTGPSARREHSEQKMIEALKSDAIVERVGGRFKLCSLIQRRLVQLMEGARPLVERQGRSDLELVIEEIMQNKIEIEFVAQPALPAGGEPAGEPAPALQ